MMENIVLMNIKSKEERERYRDTGIQPQLAP